MSQQWYVQTSEGSAGPFTPAKLRRLVQVGKVMPESLLSLDGKRWVQASKIKGLVFPSPGRAESPPQPRPAESHPDDSFPLAGDEPAPVTPGLPAGGSIYDGLTAEHLDRLYPTSSDADETPPLSGAKGFPVRVGLSATIAALAAAGTAVAVKVVRILGLIDLDTTAASLAARVGLPALAFVGTFAFIFWRSGRETEPPVITADMSDEEIARALKRH